MPENINKIEESIHPIENAGEVGGIKAEFSNDTGLTSFTEVGDKLAHDKSITVGDIAELKTLLEKAKAEANKFTYDNHEFTREEYETLVAPNLKVWEEIKRGEYGNHKKLTFLIPSVSVELAKGKGEYLDLYSLITLTPEVAVELAKSKANYLHLDGLTTLTPEVAAELVGFRGVLYLNGLTALTPEVASELAKYKGSRLYLDGLTTLTPEVAAELAKFKGESLYLYGLDGPSDNLYIHARSAHRAEQEKNK